VGCAADYYLRARHNRVHELWTELRRYSPYIENPLACNPCFFMLLEYLSRS
jgi:hypothetical protein